MYRHTSVPGTDSVLCARPALAPPPFTDVGPRGAHRPVLGKCQPSRSPVHNHHTHMDAHADARTLPPSLSLSLFLVPYGVHDPPPRIAFIQKAKTKREKRYGGDGTRGCNAARLNIVVSAAYQKLTGRARGQRSRWMAMVGFPSAQPPNGPVLVPAWPFGPLHTMSGWAALSATHRDISRWYPGARARRHSALRTHCRLLVTVDTDGASIPSIPSHPLEPLPIRT